ncbi:AI-2E family transporter [uncultured Thiodictyon sp.]|uniref:AI-2E family transporter n=1 Tax=uncultured Thiodictyon sp. TaxID=1846217 RepID=UPI0025FD370E|nr:AI-2E family transporter [uncultured Thiodictyon sp.]
MRDQLLRGGAASGRFEGWFLRVKAPGLVAAQRSADLAWRQAAQPPGVAAVPPAVIDRELGALALALYALLGIAVIHAIEATVLSPRIVGKILHLHPVLVMVVLILSEHLAGIWSPCPKVGRRPRGPSQHMVPNFLYHDDQKGGRAPEHEQAVDGHQGSQETPG